MPDPEPFDHNPVEWTEWDFRAYAEKDRRKRRELRAWNLERQEIGRFEYLLVRTLCRKRTIARCLGPFHRKCPLQIGCFEDTKTSQLYSGPNQMPRNNSVHRWAGSRFCQS